MEAVRRDELPVASRIRRNDGWNRANTDQAQHGVARARWSVAGGWRLGAGSRTEFAMTETFEPEIVAFCCHHCAYAAADLAGSMRLNYPTNVKIIKIPCTGKTDMLYLLRAFEAGVDGALVAG
jgi:hypothetical protein